MKSLDLLKQHGIITNRQFVDKLSSSGLSLYASEIEELLALKQGYLDEPQISINEAEPKLKSKICKI